MKFKKGHIPWNKGLKGFRKGHPAYYHGGFRGTHSEKTKQKMSDLKKGKSTWNKGKKMSEAQKIKLRKPKSVPSIFKGKERPELQGKNHWRYKGITPLNKLLRCSAKWQIWRNLVFLRDNFTCQNPNCSYCKNQIGIKLHPHHIKPLALYPELAFRVDNGITYCAKFHIKGGLHKQLYVKN